MNEEPVSYEFEEPGVEPEKPKKSKKEDFIVIEHDGDAESLALAIDDAVSRLAHDGTLLVTYPKSLKFDMSAYKLELYKVNIWTNPHLSNTDGRKRTGWICKK